MSETAPGPSCYRHADRETYISCQRCGRPICPDCMREASVGFQCPECVAEGRRTTRTGRTAYGGLRPSKPGVASMVLIALNAAVWLAILVTGWASSTLIHRLALAPWGVCEARSDAGAYYQVGESICAGPGFWVPGVADGAYWQLFTSVFTHVQIWHIAFNMLALWVLGPQLEIALGRARFVALYLTSGLAGSAMVMWFSAETTPTLGASGAIFGLLGALLVIAHKVGGDLSGLLGWLGANALLTFVIPNVSWQGHLGGFLGGVVVAAVLVYAPRQRRTAVQAVGVGAVVVALLVATALRASMIP